MSPDWILSPERACAAVDPELFFHPEQERGEARAERDEAAKAVCGECLFRLACRDFARERGETHGVWGGETEEERRSYLRRQGRRVRTATPVAKPGPGRPPRITDRTPCKDCGRIMRTRIKGRNRAADLDPGEVYHRAGGRCDACNGARNRKTFTARWQITDLGVDMTLAQLVAEACKGRLQVAASTQGVRIIGAYDALAWRIDTERQQLVVTGPAKVIEAEQEVAA